MREKMKWLFVFYLCVIFVISVKCDNKPNQDNWSYTIYYQDENCQTPIKASGVATNTCPPNHNTNQCVDKTVTSCTTTSTLKLTSTFAVLYSYSQDDSNCDKPVSFDALINDQCVDGLKWSYPYIMTSCTSPNKKADYGKCNNHQKMMLGGEDSQPPNSDQNTNHSDNGDVSKATLIIVIVVPVVVLIIALLLYRYFVLGQIAFSISAYYSSVQITQGTAYPVQNTQAVVELPVIYENYNDATNNGATLFPTYIEGIAEPPIVEGVAVIMTSNAV